jgi:hypothetical protein
VLISRRLTVKADKTDTTVKCNTKANSGLSGRQKITKRGYWRENLLVIFIFADQKDR